MNPQDIIQLKLYDDGRIHEKCTWNIVRSSLIEDLITRVVCEIPGLEQKRIQYLQSLDDGEIVLIDHMQQVCRCRPACYAIKMSPPIRFIGIPNLLGRYIGSFSLYARRVPRHSLNSHDVKTEHVRSWILRGILQENVTIRTYEKLLKTILSDLQNIDEKLKNLHSAKDHRARDERNNKRDESQSDEQYRLKERYEGTRENRNNVALELIKDIDLSIEPVADYENEEFLTFRIKFNGSKQDIYEAIMSQKDSWTSSSLVAYHIPEDKIDDFLRPCVEFRNYIVDLSGVILERVTNGWGSHFYKQSNEAEPTDCNGLMYHGSCINGEKVGSGISISNSAIQMGSFSGNFFCGEGTEVTNFGDILSGNFSVYMSKLHQSLIGKNPYMKSYANGFMNVLFPDGCRYRGVMVDGVFSGAGLYSLSSECIEGQFERGVLKCGRVKSVNKLVQSEFKHGLIHGRSSFLVPGRSVQGFATDGEICGKAIELFQIEENFNVRYHGNFLNGSRVGHGSVLNSLSKSVITDTIWIGNQPRRGPYSIPVSTDTVSPVEILNWSKYEKEKKQNIFSTDHSLSRTMRKVDFQALVYDFLDKSTNGDQSLHWNYNEKYAVTFDMDVISDVDSIIRVVDPICIKQLSERVVRNKKGFDMVIQMKLYEQILGRFAEKLSKTTKEQDIH